MAVDYEDPVPGDQLFQLYLWDEEYEVSQVLHHAYLVTKECTTNLSGYSDNWKVKQHYGPPKDLLFKKQIHEYIVKSECTPNTVEILIKSLDRAKFPKQSIASGKMFKVEEIMTELLYLGDKDSSIYSLPPNEQLQKVQQSLPQPKKY